MNLTLKIILGLMLGIFTGLFFGEYCSFFSYIGDTFIGLMQMTVLPYIMVNLITNLGRMKMSESRKMVINGLKVMALLIGFGVITLMILPIALPEWTASSFFKPSVVAVQEPLNFIQLYIPTNPFEAMSKNIVPAVVIFSIFLGAGLAKVRNKEALLSALDVLDAGITNINKMMVKLTPIGVFAIGAYNAGTMTIDEIQRLHAYIVLYSVAVLLLGFYWIPLLISTFTKIPPKAMFKAIRSNLLTIFATGKIIIVLPQLIDDIKKLMRLYYNRDEEMASRTEIMMPLSYPFPTLGTIVIFVFVPFIAWYLGSSFNLTENLTYLGSTLLSSFVAPVTGIPFIMDLLNLPQDMFQLFVISSIYTDRIRVVLGAIHLVSLTIITVIWTLYGIKARWKKLIKGTIIGVLITMVALYATQFYLSKTLGESHQYENFIGMKFDQKYKHAKIGNASQLFDDTLDYYGSTNHLAIIKQRKTVRIGYLSDKLPFAFKNEDGNLVGYDIEMGHLLAEELGVKAEFYRINRNQIEPLLEEGQLDIVMSGLLKTTNSLSHYAYSQSYLNQTLSFITPEYNRDKFNSRQAVKKLDNLTIGTTNSYLADKVQRYLPQANIIQLNSPRDYFKKEYNNMDALLMTAEAGAAWTVIYPNFAVTIPQPDIVKTPTAYPLPANDDNWKFFVDTWIDMKQNDGTLDKLFKFWIEGEGADIKNPRWCIARDVLGWIK